MTEMSLLRKTDLSLYYYIKDTALSNFIEVDEYVPLTFLEKISDDQSFVYEAMVDYYPSPTANGRGWVYFDEGFEATLSSGTMEQINRVKVYEEDYTSTELYKLIPDTEYIIDYTDGRIITSGTCNPTHVTYYWNYISVVDEWTEAAAAKAPVVVIDLYETFKSGYQLGGGNKPLRKVDLHIFATSTAERSDLKETLVDALFLKSCPLYDFKYGTVLDYDGTFYGRKDNRNKLTSLFDRSTIPGITNLQFDNVTARNVNLPLLMSGDQIMLDDLNRHRAKVSFDVVSYVEPK